MFQMTKADALKRQADQIEHYSAIYGPRLGDMVRAATTADQLEDDVLYDVVVINRHIPRGGSIENIIRDHFKSEA